MAAATECFHNGKKISVSRALHIKDKSTVRLPQKTFACVECGEPVKPHRSGGHAGAHFEHLERNAACSLSHRRRIASNGQGDPKRKMEFYAFDDTKALEGYEQDRTLSTRARNRTIVEQRKAKDDYRCQACDFRLEIDGSHVIECHHIKPVSTGGVREISLADLISLCPTCHRIAHTRNPPYTVDEIKKIRRQP